jgi:hypothetical protein
MKVVRVGRKISRTIYDQAYVYSKAEEKLLFWGSCTGATRITNKK